MVFPLLIIGRYCEVEHRLIGICTLCFIGCVAGPSLFVHLMIYQNVRKRQIQNQFKFCLGPSTYNMFQRVWHGIYVVFLGPSNYDMFQRVWHGIYVVFFVFVKSFLTRLDRGAGNFYIMKVDPETIDKVNKSQENNLKASIC